MASSFSMERRPRMLKDFLIDEFPSCSTKDLKSLYPGKPCKLLRARSRSSKAASISISAVHKASDMVINAIKFFPFVTMKNPAAILPRSISKKLSRRPTTNKEDRNINIDGSVKVKIKDILRWKSFRDVVMELEDQIIKPPLPTPVEFSCSNTFTTGSSSSKRSSWCESDFTVEEEDQLSPCFGEDKDFMNENGGIRFSTAEDYVQDNVEGTRTGTASKRELGFDEEDLNSPVSVLESPFGEDQEFFHKSLATIQRRKCRLMERIEEFESLANKEAPNSNFLCKDLFTSKEDSISFLEEDEAIYRKALQILSQVKAKRSTKYDHDQLLMDFFMQELGQNEAKLEGEMMRLAESWLSKACNGPIDWEMLGKKREECVRDMEEGMKWKSFEEEKQELGCLLENEVMNDLFNDILVDLMNQ